MPLVVNKILFMARALIFFWCKTYWKYYHASQLQKITFEMFGKSIIYNFHALEAFVGKHKTVGK